MLPIQHFRFNIMAYFKDNKLKVVIHCVSRFYLLATSNNKDVIHHVLLFEIQEKKTNTSDSPMEIEYTNS